jgi:hypothetical protein
MKGPRTLVYVATLVLFACGGEDGTSTGSTTSAAGGSTGGSTTGNTSSGDTTTGGGGGSTGGQGGSSRGGAGGHLPSDAGHNPCDAVRCAQGTHCVVEGIACIPEQPCSGLMTARCVPDTKVPCGGFTGAGCPGLGTCVDDPSDTCDPNQGGADCPGLCQCTAMPKCATGNHFDSSPSICACAPGP